jgi:hypothetical protein
MEPYTTDVVYRVAMIPESRVHQESTRSPPSYLYIHESTFRDCQAWQQNYSHQEAEISDRGRQDQQSY